MNVPKKEGIERGKKGDGLKAAEESQIQYKSI